MLPETRPAEELVISPVGKEMVIYDRQRQKAHSLNPTAAFVFEHLARQNSPAELTTLLAAEYNLTEAQASDLMWLSLDRLEKAHLLQGKVTRPNHLTRRQMLKLVGTTAVLLPVVATIVANPPQAHASQGVGDGETPPKHPKPPKPKKPKRPKKPKEWRD
jgi:hypothetical protein